MPKMNTNKERKFIQMMKKMEKVNPNALERIIGMAQGILFYETDKRIKKIEGGK